jgi:hypothetical protein
MKKPDEEKRKPIKRAVRCRVCGSVAYATTGVKYLGSCSCWCHTCQRTTNHVVC